MFRFYSGNGDQEGDITLKFDQENATKHLCIQILEERRDGKTVCEEAPDRSSGSNGVVERGFRRWRDKSGFYLWD